MRKQILLGGVAGLFAVGLLMGGAKKTEATLDMQKKAKAAGYEATNCLYCHGEKLPKKGACTNNARGQWLKDEKEKRKAKEIDVNWLKDYVEPKT
jgi:hypothetical protein